jgi:AAA domain
MAATGEPGMDQEPPEWATEDAGLDDLDSAYDKAEGRPGANGGAKPFEFTLLDEVRANLGNLWIVKGLIPKAGFGVIYGPPGSGKTAIALDMALHIAAGLEYRGRRTERQPVVYVILEGHGGVTNRVVAARDRLGIEGAAFAVVKATADFRDPDNAFNAAAVARQICAGFEKPNPLVVVDTLQAALGPGGSDCDPRDVGALIEGIKEHLVMRDMTALAVHHSGKDAGRGARGWSGLNAAIDFELEVGRDDDLRTMVISKMRDGSDEQATSCYRLLPWRLGEDEYGEEVSTVVVEHAADAGKGKTKRLSPKANAALQQLWKLIKDGPSWPLDGGPLKCTTMGHWATACQADGAISSSKQPRDRRAKFKAAVNELLDKGAVTVDGDPEGKGRVYPTPKGDDLARRLHEALNATDGAG